MSADGSQHSKPLPAIVKAVPSGDTLLLMGADASRGPPPEKLVSLTGLSAPRLANRSGTPDQPFAWDAREFLRRLTIGKHVTFVIEAAPNAPTPAGTTPREFGSVFLEGVPLQQLIIAEGWARIKGASLQDEDMVALQAAAEAAHKGIFNEANAASSVRSIKWAGTFDPTSLLNIYINKPQPAVIEQVPSGSFLRAFLVPGFEQVTLSLSGIQCPPIKRGEDGNEEAAPFAKEARFFVESRLLHRDVQLILQGVDKNGTLLGTVVHEKGSISLELVRAGLARVVDWSSSLCDNAKELREAERGAKARRARIWKDYTPPQVAQESQARVVEIVSGDTLVVQDADGAEARYTLSSIRAPRMGKDPEPYASEAKEALRKMLIGKKVKVLPEYRRTIESAGGQAHERSFAAILFDKSDKNAAEALVADGLATVSRHGQADERSQFYDALLDAEADATAAKRGMHSATPFKRGAAPTDLSLPAAKDRAKSFLSNFTRGGAMRGVVQFVLNGSRVKVLLSKDNCLITLGLAGVRCPSCSRRDTGAAGEPYGDEALAMTRALCLQRDVTVEVEGVNDKTGVFSGSIFLPDKRNLSVLLLEAGLATRFGPAADRSPHSTAMFEAETAAKERGIKLWENYSEQAEAEAAAAAAAAAAAEMEAIPDSQKQRVDLMLTEIVDGARFYAHVASDDTLTRLQEKLAAICSGPPLATAFEPKVGAVLCARFTQDDCWYRAKVLKRDKGDYTVFFLDYGNTDVLAPSRLRPLDPSLATSVISPQAVECRLAYLIVEEPNPGSDGEDAAVALGTAAWGKPVVARVEDRQAGVLHVTLFDSANGCVNEQLVRSGLARVSKQGIPRRAEPLVASLRSIEEGAKKAHLGVWRYGDIEEDDAHEFGFRPVAPAAPKAGNPWKK